MRSVGVRFLAGPDPGATYGGRCFPRVGSRVTMGHARHHTRGAHADNLELGLPDDTGQRPVAAAGSENKSSE